MITNMNQDRDNQDRIVEALERIADALEAINERYRAQVQLKANKEYWS
jgi:hypothetical protein